MTRYLPKLSDGSDPLYAPHVVKAKRNYYWRVPAWAKAAGYDHPAIRLPGVEGDGRELERAARARELTIDMRDAIEGGSVQRTALAGTWGWLIARYLSDEDSPFQDLKANTRDSYRWVIKRWEDVIGLDQIEEMDFAELRHIQRRMQANGASRDYIKRTFTMLRIIVGYGVLLRNAHCRDLSAILAEMRIKGAKHRTAAPTRGQIMAIIAEADKAGDAGFALGLSIQWWFALRAVDVRGQWLRLRDDEIETARIGGGILRGSFRWADGLTWDMVSRDLSEFRKVPSKTEDSLDEELIFDLTLVPEIRERLSAIPQTERIGPVIRDPKTGEPYDRYRWTKLFGLYRGRAGVPDDILMMDTRAGAITDAKRAGASEVLMQHQANHASPDTTSRYVRERSDSISKVVELRKAASRK